MPTFFSLIDAALNHSIYWEEGKGNYLEAQRLAEAALQSAPAPAWEARLTRGYVHLLQGETNLALEHFTAVKQEAPRDTTAWARAADLRFWAQLAANNT